MLRLIIIVLLIMLIAALVGMDSCTCGMGPEIRQNLKDIFGSIETEESDKGIAFENVKSGKVTVKALAVPKPDVGPDLEISFEDDKFKSSEE